MEFNGIDEENDSKVSTTRKQFKNTLTLLKVRNLLAGTD